MDDLDVPPHQLARRSDRLPELPPGRLEPLGDDVLRPVERPRELYVLAEAVDLGRERVEAVVEGDVAERGEREPEEDLRRVSDLRLG